MDDGELDEQADANAAAWNPYHGIRLEGRLIVQITKVRRLANSSCALELLAPLTSAADLPNHPSMSIPYKSSTLSDMVQHASEMLHRERRTLWNSKQLLTSLRGDATWIPCGALNSDLDNVIFDTGPIYREIIESEIRENSTSAKKPTLVNGEASVQLPTQTKNRDPSLNASLAETRRSSKEKIYEAAESHSSGDRPSGLGAGSTATATATATADAAIDKQKESDSVDNKEGNVEIKEESLSAAPHCMQTRARAQAKSENTASSRTRSPSAASRTPPVVHPLFLMPASAYPDRNFGLPPGEAEDTRRMVTLYVQKQEEVCRSAEKLYVGLLKANRMRKTVFKWCKAEGHVGEMSDGEDWYDKEDWGLDEDLRKGQEEEEDEKDKEKEGGGTQTKKTRKPRVTALK